MDKQMWYIPNTEYCCCSVAKFCLTLHKPMDCKTPGFPVPHHLPESEILFSLKKEENSDACYDIDEP